MSELILIVDDEPVQRRLLEATVQKLGYKTITADGGIPAIEALSGKDSGRIKAVILDVIMPDIDGLEVLKVMQEKNFKQPVIVQTAQGGVEIAVNAMRAGAVDFVIKPAAPERLKVSLQNALQLNALQGEIKRIKKKTSGQLTIKEMICESPSMHQVKNIATKAAGSNIPVLIEGESGVGKEMIARTIQGMSERSAKSFVTVNCGALPENLVESILFGHEKGAFTGASDKHLGKFQEAHGGTLFLDEVGELTLDMQVKLLRAIQEGEVDPVGASKPVKVDFRLVSATNRNLIKEVEEGNFREDLFYRLNVLPITVPPLRERTEDIPALLRNFIARIAAEEGRTNIKGIDKQTLDMLCAFEWPGNIRQLENAVFRAVVLCEGDELTVNEFPQIAMKSNFELKPVSAPAPIQAETLEVTQAPSIEFNPEDRLETRDETSANENSMMNATGDVKTLEEAECDLIRFALEKYDGKMSQIARKLGIGRSTLYRKLSEYGLDQKSDNTDENKISS